VKQEELSALLSPVVAGLGLECLGIELAGGHGNLLLRVYIDVPGRAVTLEDCEAASREVSAVMDLQDPIAGHYTLEVSSPGVDRPLFSPAQFARYLGQNAKVTLNLPLAGRRRVQGPIRAVEGERITIEQDGTPLVIEHGNVLKANLVHEWDSGGRKPGRKRK
jgi:ribosome maturation factor RimP